MEEEAPAEGQDLRGLAEGDGFEVGLEGLAEEAKKCWDTVSPKGFVKNTPTVKSELHEKVMQFSSVMEILVRQD